MLFIIQGFDGLIHLGDKVYHNSDPCHYKMITLRLPLIFGTNLNEFQSDITLNDISEASNVLLLNFKLKSDEFYLKKCFEDCFQVKLRLRGGKGGFGSQLRAQGNKMSSKKRAGNYESCRSLNGQRIRVQKQTKLIEEYLAKEPERLSKREQEIREKMQKYLEAPDKKVMFSDPDYLKLCRKLVDSTEDAVRSGLRSQKANLSTNSGSDSDDNSDCSNENVDSHDESEINGSDEKESNNLQGLEDLDEKGPAVDERSSINSNRKQSKYLDKYLKK